MRGLAALAAPAPEARSAWNDGGSSWFSPGSTTVTENTAFNLSAVWACETLIADSVSVLPVGTFRRKSDTERVATPRPLWMDQPNPECSGINYEIQRVLSILSWGNAYSYLLRKNGSIDPMMPVEERWLLNPAHVEVRRVKNAYDERAQLAYYIRGEQVPNSVIQHVPGYVAPGWFLGMSVIQHAARGLGMAVSAELAGANIYEQGMHQSGVLEVPQMPAEVSKQVTDRLRESIMDRHAGSGNAGKPMVLTGGTTWKPAMLTPSDAQYLETRKFQIDEICRWFRVPPHLIGHIEPHASQGGGNGLEQQSTEFMQFNLTPLVRRLEFEDSKLVPRGQYVKYNLDAFVRSDLTTQNASFTAGRLGGWLSVNDIRTLKDMPPIDNGDIYLTPANYYEAGAQAPEAPAQGIQEPVAAPAA